MAQNNKQYLIPGYGYVDEKDEGEQWLIPGYGYTNEEAATAGGTRPQSPFNHAFIGALGGPIG